MNRLLSRVIPKIVNVFSAYSLSPPYEYVQNITEHCLHDYLDVKRSDITQIVIVGGYLGLEIPRLLKSYPSASIVVFEASDRYYDKITSKYQNNDRVKVENFAVTDEIGTTEFFETNLRGSGSVLRVGELAEKSYGAKQAESFEVKTTTLDKYFSGKKVDCLWVDVQGAEKMVLNGASETLKSANSIFIETSIFPDLYEGGTLFSEIYELTKEYGFEITLLGTDRLNLTGNALFTKRVS